MVQHVLLMLVAAPLIALSAPVTLLLRLSAPATRQRRILPVLHSRVVRVLAFPVVAWVIFAAMMWGTHFSPLFNASLEDPGLACPLAKTGHGQLVQDLRHTSSRKALAPSQCCSRCDLSSLRLASPFQGALQ
jgi:hypothetical protein